jgi:hypothetical protein
MNEEKLNKELNKWFEINFKKLNQLDKNIWYVNPVAKLIKNKMKDLGRWKTMGRGNPAKGFKKMQYVRAVNNGYQGEFKG